MKPKSKFIISVLLMSGVFGTILSSGLSQNNATANEVINHTIQAQAKTLEKKSLTIGVVTDPAPYEELKKYLKTQYPDVDIKIENAGEENRNRIIKKQWDIVFSFTPINSVVAEDNGYTWLGRMYPNDPPFFQAALFVKKNSPIKSLKDINSKTIVALGNFNSVTGFYVPIFDLYGKTMILKVKTSDVKAEVASGKADVGAFVYDLIKDNPDFVIIHRSKNLTGAGVFLSPNLSASDREQLKTVLLNAPKEVRDKANYGPGEPRDYSTFRGITRRVEQIVQCVDFNKQPVKIFCAKDSKSSNSSENLVLITGVINGSSIIDDNTTRLNIQGDDRKNYQLFVSPKILNQIPNGGNSIMLQNRRVKVFGVIPEKMNNNIFKLVINNSDQLQVMP